MKEESEELFDLRVLRQNPDNPFPFTGTDEQWEKFTGNLVDDLEYLEAINIVYDSSQDNLIIAGNKRTKGLIENDIFHVSQRSVFDCKDWDKEKRHKFIVASNKNWGTWDEEIVAMHFEEIAFDYDISFEDEVIDETDYSEKNKEIDVDDLGDDMKLSLNFDSSIYWEVKKRLSEIAQTPEAAVCKLLGIEDEYNEAA